MVRRCSHDRADRAVASSDAQTAAGFFSSYYISLLQDTFYVLSDTDHRAAFKNQVRGRG